MKISKIKSKTAQQIIPKAENQKRIENHKKAATHFDAAAKSHLDAAKYHKNGNYEKAVKSTIEAHGHSNLANKAQRETVKNNFLTGYPVNPSTEDVYNKWKEETELNPEDITKQKTPNEMPNTRNEKGFADDMSGSDLDIPGSELDDEQENVGSEDEENNYYSIGGDRHNDLEEDKA